MVILIPSLVKEFVTIMPCIDRTNKEQFTCENNPITINKLRGTIKQKIVIQ